MTRSRSRTDCLLGMVEYDDTVGTRGWSDGGLLG